MYRQLPLPMIRRIEELIDASYSGRDELYAAANSLTDEERSSVCRQLAEHLADHATELQQLLLANGGDTIAPLDMYAVADGFFHFARQRHGDAEVLRIAENCERTVKERFEEAIDDTKDEDTAALLQRQRDDVEFGEHVLRSMQDPAKQDPERPDPAKQD